MGTACTRINIKTKQSNEDLLNRPAPRDLPDILPASDDLPINCDPSTKKETYKDIKCLKNGKSAGPESIPAEALKTDIETIVKLLYPLFKKIWEEEQVPSEWKKGYLIKLPKKGDISSCTNYRGIILLSIPGKAFSQVLLNRSKDAAAPPSSRPPGWLSQGQVLHRPDSNTAHHYRTVMRMELPSLCQLYWLREGI